MEKYSGSSSRMSSGWLRRILASMGVVSICGANARSQTYLPSEPRAAYSTIPAHENSQTDLANEVSIPADDDPPMPVMVEALRFQLTRGRTITGIDDGKYCSTAFVLVRGVRIPILDTFVEDVQRQPVDALSVASADYVFTQICMARRLGSAADLFSLARDAEALSLFVEAKEHYKQALERDPEFSDAGRARARIARIEALAAMAKPTSIAEEARKRTNEPETEPHPRDVGAKTPDEKQVEESDDTKKDGDESQSAEPADRVLMKKIDALYRQGKHEASLDAGLDFFCQFDESDLRTAVASCLKDVLDSRRAAKSKKVQSEFLAVAKQLCQKRATDPGDGIEAAMDWAKNECFATSLQIIAKRHDLGGECEALDLWRNRYEHSSGSAANYGPGSFVSPWFTGHSAIVKVPPSPDEWWRASTTKSSERTNFLFSYFGEYARYNDEKGLIRVSPGNSKYCNTCSGRGRLPPSRSVRGGGLFPQPPCDRCKGLKIDRGIVLR